jgi:hypothetical protein
MSPLVQAGALLDPRPRAPPDFEVDDPSHIGRSLERGSDKSSEAPESHRGLGVYIVPNKQHAVANNAAARIQSVGGTLVASYSQIGVAIARSSNTAFAAIMKKDLRDQRRCVQAMSTTTRSTGMGR